MELADRLESGKYEQGRGNLLAEGKFCCLGVLSEMAVEAGIAVWIPLSYADAVKCVDVQLSGENDYPSESSGVLTNNTVGWAGMRTLTGEFAESAEFGGCNALTTANDSGVSFPQIAAYIRENYETL
jgi:hypothetical protein